MYCSKLRSFMSSLSRSHGLLGYHPEEWLLCSHPWNAPMPRRFTNHVEAVPGEKSSLREDRLYDREKMSNLFDDVKTVEGDDGALSAELSGITSSIAGVCWHRDALSDYVRDDDTDHTSAGSAGSSYHEDGKSYIHDSIVEQQKDAMLEQMRLLMENERKERERIRGVIERQQKLRIGKTASHVAVNRDVSTMKLLTIASDISGRKPAQAKPQLEERTTRREQAYYRNINKVPKAVTDIDGYYSRKRTSTTELVRVLDVDALPLPMLHHMACYTMVKHMPAETVLKVISRVAMLRDKESHVAYQNFLRDVSRICSPLCRAEIVALLARCYQSISVPFMVDYVRRYGTFSRRFMAKLIQTHSKPLPLDFLRYRAGQRSMNQIMTRPWALFGYVKMLKRSSAKTYMYHSLLARGYVPKEDEFDRYHSFGTLDAKMATTIINSEKMLNSTLELDPQKANSDPNRPSIYEEVLEAQVLGIPLEDVHEEGCDQEGAVVPSAVGTQMVKIQGDLPQHGTTKEEPVFRDVEDDVPPNRANISWSAPWGRKRDVFHFQGKTYAMDAQQGWRIIKSPVRTHYLKNVKMNKRKRERKALRLWASKLARRALASRIDTLQN